VLKHATNHTQQRCATYKKKLMKYILIFFALLISAFSFAQQDLSNIPQLQTKATYTAEVNPDKITLSVTLSEENTRGKVSIEQLEKRMEKVLIENNVDLKKQLVLVDLSSNFKNYFLRKNDVQKTKNYQLIMFDAQSAGKILKGLEKQEISNVELVKTEYIKLEELKIELKGKAVEKAKRQAEEMVKNLNQKLGSAIFISDLATNISRQLNGSNTGSNFIVGYATQEAQLDVEFDKIRVDATVTVYFKLE
jgi:uncharacterized protein YggE